ncbi:MAG: uracil-DNA glycosylase family protein, partial [Alphaproteobacteria bacterium]|nr:uracil-DNA glycosylase family protein [Alphaproteobacteria bacterium]
MSAALERAIRKAKACRLCAGTLPHAPRPVLRAKPDARLLIISQAPGTKVHTSGLPFDDASGDRLRDWLGVDRPTFYDHPALALMPMGFCFPGQDAKGGDLPPMKICAPTWHPVILPLMPKVELILLVGQYAQARYLGRARRGSLTETVRAWRDHGPRFLPLPHPSWRNTGWLKANPWFAREVVPTLRRRVSELLAPATPDDTVQAVA